ncbi:MAG: CoA pyrophosphatase [Acidobacteriota bacterium]|nr:CoA pyrophosphatase [Acidobacteriota bacterium]
MSDFELIRRHLEERLAPPHSLLIERERIRQAAVTLLLREEQGAAELFIIKRADREGDPWSGHLALPGGRAELPDTDLMATAARETHEEVGIDLLNGGVFIGQLPLIKPIAPRLPQIEITPLVALAPLSLSICLSEEVDRVFWVPIGQLKRAGLSDVYARRFGELVRKWPAYASEDGPIWGITERILTSFLSLLD